MKNRPPRPGAARPGSSSGRAGGAHAFFASLPAILAILAVAGLMALRIARPDAVVADGSGPPSALPEPAGKTAGAADAAGPTAGDIPPAGLPLRIATWNVRDCAISDAKTGERISLHDGIAAVVRDLRVDIIVFEEIQRDDGKGGDIALLSVALAKAGWAMPWNSSVESGGQDDLAVFSRYRILSSEAVLAPGEAKAWPRPGIRAEVDTGAGHLQLYGFHFKAMSDPESQAARLRQATALAGLLRAEIGAGTAPGADNVHGIHNTDSSDSSNNAANALIVVGGDFNTTNTDELSGPGSTLAMLQLKDNADPSDDFLAANLRYLPGIPTYADERYRSVLDHIILSPAAARSLVPGSVSIAELPETNGAAPLSDHRPVLVELSLPLR
ncbi:MAG: endonuclease/exonuclease/phosphatase family protein [Rectinemataceae bacterium]